MFLFGSFQLDVVNASLRRGQQALVLTPKAFNVLRYLVEHAGQLVTKDELGRAVWPGVTAATTAFRRSNSGQASRNARRCSWQKGQPKCRRKTKTTARLRHNSDSRRSQPAAS